MPRPENVKVAHAHTKPIMFFNCGMGSKQKRRRPLPSSPPPSHDGPSEDGNALGRSRCATIRREDSVPSNFLLKETGGFEGLVVEDWSYFDVPERRGGMGTGAVAGGGGSPMQDDPPLTFRSGSDSEYKYQRSSSFPLRYTNDSEMSTDDPDGRFSAERHSSPRRNLHWKHPSPSFDTCSSTSASSPSMSPSAASRAEARALRRKSRRFGSVPRLPTSDLLSVENLNQLDEIQPLADELNEPNTNDLKSAISERSAIANANVRSGRARTTPTPGYLGFDGPPPGVCVSCMVRRAAPGYPSCCRGCADFSGCSCTGPVLSVDWTAEVSCAEQKPEQEQGRARTAASMMTTHVPEGEESDGADLMAAASASASATSAVAISLPSDVLSAAAQALAPNLVDDRRLVDAQLNTLVAAPGTARRSSHDESTSRRSSQDSQAPETLQWITGAKARASLCAEAKRSGSIPPAVTKTPTPTPVLAPTQTPALLPPPLDAETSATLSNTDADVEAGVSHGKVLTGALASWRPFSPADEARPSESGDDIECDTHEFEVDPSVWEDNPDAVGADADYVSDADFAANAGVTSDVGADVGDNGFDCVEGARGDDESGDADDEADRNMNASLGINRLANEADDAIADRARAASSALSADGDAGAGSARGLHDADLGRPSFEATRSQWRERPNSGDWRLRASTASPEPWSGCPAHDLAVETLTRCTSTKALEQGSDGGVENDRPDEDATTHKGATRTSSHEAWTTNLDTDFGQQSSGRRVAPNRRASDGDAGAGAGAGAGSGTGTARLGSPPLGLARTGIKKNLRSNIRRGVTDFADLGNSDAPPPPAHLRDKVPPPPPRGRSDSGFALSPGAPHGYGHFVVPSTSDGALHHASSVDSVSNFNQRECADTFSALLNSFGVGEIPSPPPPIVNPQPKKAVSFPKVPSEPWPIGEDDDKSFPPADGTNPFGGAEEGDDDGPLVIHILDRKRNRAFSVEAISADAIPRPASATGISIRSPSPLGMKSPPRVKSPQDFRDDPDNSSSGGSLGGKEPMGGDGSKQSSTGTLETHTGWQFPQNPEIDLQQMLWKLVCNDNLAGNSNGSLESLSRVPSANGLSARNRSDSLPAWVDTRHSVDTDGREGAAKRGGVCGCEDGEEEYEDRHCSGCGRFATATRKTRVRKNEYYFCETKCWEKWLEGGMQDVVIENPDLANSGSIKAKGRGDSLGDILGVMVGAESRSRLKSASSLSL